MPSIYDSIITQNIITIAAGSDSLHTWPPVLKADGTPQDLTGATIAAQLRTLNDCLVGTFICSAPSPATGIVVGLLPAAQSVRLAPGGGAVNHVWGVEIRLADGNLLPELQGGALVTRKIVRAGTGTVIPGSGPVDLDGGNFTDQNQNTIDGGAFT